MQAESANPRLMGRVTGVVFRVAKDWELVAGEYSRLRFGRRRRRAVACRLGLLAGFGRYEMPTLQMIDQLP